ncbi:hypothetical protein FAUST_11029 [Fusarium austroamericanum]|uniref:Uncharacterized protein n=1 Tax=Fusarium austroamericanum TaxID=282268 RepID=A0AAN5Z229_FUSAU|nr:hypothetical protein FAUST_11029 [Fusarium austroamericanum]
MIVTVSNIITLNHERSPRPRFGHVQNDCPKWLELQEREAEVQELLAKYNALAAKHGAEILHRNDAHAAAARPRFVAVSEPQVHPGQDQEAVVADLLAKDNELAARRQPQDSSTAPAPARLSRFVMLSAPAAPVDSHSPPWGAA